MELISTHVGTIEVAELEARVAALGKKQSPSEKKVGIESHPLYKSILAWEEADKEAREGSVQNFSHLRFA